MTTPLRATRAEINLDNLKHNLSSFREQIAAKTKIMAVVKADGYGHGAVEVSKVALEHGATWLGVAFVEEGIKLREHGFEVPLLVLNSPFANQVELFFKHNLIPTVFTKDMARLFSKHAVERKQKKEIHLKVDTGMGRVGVFPYTAAEEYLENVRKLPNLTVGGIYTHFATADEKDKSYAELQLQRFLDLINRLKKKGICPPLVHAANSAAALEIPESWLGMVRLGISMYGHYPSKEVDKKIIALKPLMNLKSSISFLKLVPAGTCISYGCTWVTEKETRVATIPLGYGDGYSRLLSNKAHVLIRGKRHPVIGRVCMDQFMVDVSADPKIKAGDEVILFGEQGNQPISVEEIADLLGTINYEVLCAVGKRVPRVYL
ncbi:MAG: alanine racemase [Bacillota bacterium]